MSRHHFSNSERTRAAIRALAVEPVFKAWENIPLETRLAILLHIQDTIEEVLNESQA